MTSWEQVSFSGRTALRGISYLLLTYPWSRVLLEKLTGSQLVKKFPAFYGTRRFITAVTSARHLSLSWASSIQSIPPHLTSWRSILILSSHLRLGPMELFYVFHSWQHVVFYKIHLNCIKATLTSKPVQRSGYLMADRGIGARYSVEETSELSALCSSHFTPEERTPCTLSTGRCVSSRAGVDSLKVWEIFCIHRQSIYSCILIVRPCILNVVHVFLLLSTYTYCCLCILIVRPCILIVVYIYLLLSRYS